MKAIYQTYITCMKMSKVKKFPFRHEGTDRCSDVWYGLLLGKSAIHIFVQDTGD